MIEEYKRISKDWPPRDCGHCHTCGTKLLTNMDGEEWCDECKTYVRYRSHGWTHGEMSQCGGKEVENE